MNLALTRFFDTHVKMSYIISNSFNFTSISNTLTCSRKYKLVFTIKDYWLLRTNSMSYNHKESFCHPMEGLLSFFHSAEANFQTVDDNRQYFIRNCAVMWFYTLGLFALVIGIFQVRTKVLH